MNSGWEIHLESVGIWLVLIGSVLAATLSVVLVSARARLLAFFFECLFFAILLLALGAEYLAMTTLGIALVSVLTASVFSSRWEEAGKIAAEKKDYLHTVLGVGTGLGLGALLGVLLWQILESKQILVVSQTGSISSFGVDLLNRHVFILELLALVMFSAAVGFGVLMRQGSKRC